MLRVCRERVTPVLGSAGASVGLSIRGNDGQTAGDSFVMDLEWDERERIMRSVDDDHGVSPPQHAITEDDVRAFPDHFLRGAGQHAAEQSLGEGRMAELGEELDDHV